MNRTTILADLDKLIGGDLEPDCCPVVDLVQLRRVFLLLAQAHFSDAANYGKYKELLECLTFNPDEPDKSSLQVSLAHTYNPNNKDQRPAVYVRSGLLSLEGRFIGNYAGSSYNNATTYQVLAGEAVISLLAIHSSLDIATTLAESAMACFIGLRQVIMTQMGMQALDVISVGEPEKESERPEGYFRVDLKIRIKLPIAVATIEESHVLKKLTLQADFQEA